MIVRDSPITIDGHVYSRGTMRVAGSFDCYFPDNVFRDGRLIKARYYPAKSESEDFEHWQLDCQANREVNKLEQRLTEGDGRYWEDSNVIVVLYLLIKYSAIDVITKKMHLDMRKINPEDWLRRELLCEKQGVAKEYLSRILEYLGFGYINYELSCPVGIVDVLGLHYPSNTIAFGECSMCRIGKVVEALVVPGGQLWHLRSDSTLDIYKRGKAWGKIVSSGNDPYQNYVSELFSPEYVAGYWKYISENPQMLKPKSGVKNINRNWLFNADKK